MEYTLLAILVICATVSSTVGLKCYTCTDMNFETNNAQLKEILKGNLKRDVACGEDDVSRMETETCQEGGASGIVPKCMKTKVEASAEAQGQSVSFTTVIRACALMPASAEDTCETMDDESAVNSILGMQGVDIDDFEASKCLCGTDSCNGQTTIVPGITTCLLSLALAIYAFW